MTNATAAGPRLAFDIETDGLLRELTRIWVLCIGDLDTQEVARYTDYDPNYPSVAEGVARLMGASLLVAHNGLGFDREAIGKVTGQWLPLDRLHDTLVMGRLRDPERLGGHKLESYGVEMGILKGTYDDWSRYTDEMGAYCEQDVRVTLALYDKLKAVLTWGESFFLEMAVAYLIEQQMRNGFTLDVNAGILLAAEIDAERQRLQAELQRVFPPQYVAVEAKTPKRSRTMKAGPGGAPCGYTEGCPYTVITLQEFNPGSEYHVARRLLARYGWVAPLTEKGNPNITEAVLKKLDYPEADLLVRFAREDKRWTQLASPPKSNGTGGGWLHHADETNRVHGYVNPNGAVTGRMTHSRPNSANIDKDPRMRALWIPGVGWVLVGCDAEGLELRMLAHYLTPWDGGALTHALLEGDKSKGTDAHSMNRKNTDLFSRDGAKTLLYGSLYGAGDEKAGAIWVADWRSSGKPESEWPQWAFMARGKQRRLRTLKAIGREVKARLIDGIKGYRQLIEAVQKKAEKFGWIRSLDGRRIRIRSSHAALNSLLQGGGAVVMKKALVILDQKLRAAGLVHGRDFGYCANVHDEWQIECKPELAAFIGEAGKQAITEAGEVLGVLCRLDGAFDIGKNWHETH